MTEQNNEWIKGNEPKESGWYEVTYNGSEYIVLVLEYRKGLSSFGWLGYPDDGVIAYKPITLSEPYKEPERELRCPFCGSLNCGIVKNVEGMGFFCHDCDSKVPRIKTKEQLFEIYDKLKGETK